MRFFFLWELSEQLNLLYSKEDPKNMRFFFLWELSEQLNLFLLQPL